MENKWIIPHLTRLERTKKKLYQGCDVYIGSIWELGGWNLPHSKWASSFSDIKDYEQHIRQSTSLMHDLDELNNCVLGCWCRQEDREQCHGYVLIKLFQEKHPEAIISPALVNKHHHPEGKEDTVPKKASKRKATSSKTSSQKVVKSDVPEEEKIVQKKRKKEQSDETKENKKKKSKSQTRMEDEEYVPKIKNKGHTWSSILKVIQPLLPKDFDDSDFSRKFYRNQDTHPEGIMQSKHMNPWPPLELKDHEHTIWVDEAGQGSWAGPLHIGATYILPGFNIKGIHDSKMLQEHERFVLYHRLINSPHIVYHVESVLPEEIDSPSIGTAWHNGTRRAVEKLMGKLKERCPQVKITQVVVDGCKMIKKCPVPVKAISKADSMFVGVGAAAILAKVSRDLLMKELSQKPEYEKFKDIFSRGKGYCYSEEHRTLIDSGVYTDQHRKSFNPLRTYLASLKKVKHTDKTLQQLDPQAMVDLF